MPPLPPAQRCTFTGTAAAIDLRGEGPAVLADRTPFSDGHADRVELLGASIGPARSPILDHPTDLDPVNMNPDGAPYDVSYRAGPPVTIVITRGGGIGHFRGALADAPICAAAHGCDITWSGARTLVLHRADPTPIDLTGAFPFGEPDPLAPTQPPVHEITLHGAHGTLRCADGDRPLDGDWLFRETPSHALTVAPIRIEPAKGLGVSVENDLPPTPLGLSGAALAARVGLGAVGVGILGALVLLGLRRRRRPPPQPPAEQAPTEAIAVYCVYAPEDEELCQKLAKHLRSPGLDLRGRWRLQAGQEEKTTDAWLDQAPMILLMVSADLLSAEGRCQAQVERAMARHKAGEAVVMPVLLRSCDWKDAPFGSLSPLPASGQPVASAPSLDAALTEVAQGIKVARGIKDRSGLSARARRA